MPVLRLRQTTEGEHRYKVLLELEEGGVRREDTRSFTFELTPRDQEDLRWYLEDYLQYPLDPAPKIAKRIEERMDQIGNDLFHRVLEGTSVWGEVRNLRSDTRVEVVTEVKEATAIPWELLRDPEAGVPLALQVRAFVRATHNAVQRAKLPQTAEGPVRVLLAICRPQGGGDVPFRSVARRLVEGFRGIDAVRLTVLRPPTFERLSAVLHDAKAKGEPFHLVHFDGHGVWSEEGPRKGGHGYLLFENPDREENRELIDGPKLGALLIREGAGVLVVNACQSAYAMPPREPVAAVPANVHEETRTIGSLAQEVMDAGATGVVAMRYSVLVETAARFMKDLYERLMRGETLGEAVTYGRFQLDTDPRRDVGFGPIPLRDWAVPVVFEAAPLVLFPKRAGAAKLEFQTGGVVALEGLPSRPDAGFFGRDETLLALDRAFDRQRIVLLHAYAGSGKTAAVAEFARWYHETGGILGPVLFTSFEQHKPLARVLDQVGQAFGKGLEQAGVNWLAKNDQERREIALDVLRQVPVLWIWDNVEPVAGFPTGTESQWTPEEQRELADFLRAARETQARFLLTSRRDERGWLGDLPVRVALPPMPFQERLEMARGLAEKQSRRLTEVEDWRPLLEFTQGNPLTVTVLVRQALRDGLRTRQQIEAFVARLRAGEAAFEDEVSEGRTKSLAASLNYGFEHAFNEAERKQLSLLHLFQGFVQVGSLRTMGNPKAEWHLSELRGLTQEDSIRLLDRAAEVGLLTALGHVSYSIHPAVPWFFRRLFEERDAEARERALRAYVEAVGELGNYYIRQYVEGDRGVIEVLRSEEPNLLRALGIARRQGWWNSVMGVMQGLYSLYDHTGRQTEWRHLVEEIVPDFVDTTTEGPLPGREERWSVLTEYRVGLKRRARQWAEAERLQRLRVEWDRQRAQDDDPSTVRSLAASLHALGQIQRETSRLDCVKSYKESFDLAQQIGDSSFASIAAFNLGNAHIDLRDMRDLADAEKWCRKGLELVPETDRMGRAASLGQLGRVAYERFLEGREAGQPEAALVRHLRNAQQSYHQALEMTSPDAPQYLAVGHGQLGILYADASQLDRALHHFRESIRFHESTDNLYGVAETGRNIAITLLKAGRFADAKDYALAALHNYQTYGDSAQEKVQLTLDLIALIEQAASSQS
ncbi:MAG: CHAT domain-containing protein [Acidobacteriia bacterium]|nr:CHAT domain-containing protein [Terriglobia bacterium]